MGLLETLPADIDTVKQKIKNPFSRTVDSSGLNGPDFPNGFLIEELSGPKDKIRLTGNTMPFVPFTFGGRQRMVKEYYPGNAEPVVHVFGPEESNITINGRLKDKRFSDPNLYGLSTEIQELIDSIRYRGNLCRFQLGLWQRYGFLEETKWDLKRLGDINYSISFSIVGFNKPRDCQFLEKTLEVPFSINKSLIDQLETFQEEGSGGIPTEVPASISDILNDAISDVAAPISAVTSFVDTVVAQAEDISKSIARALGLIKKAKADVSIFKRRVGAIGYNVTGDPVNSKFISSSLSNGPRSTQYLTAAHVNNTLSSSNSLLELLELMRKQFDFIANTVPLARHRVQLGDTLQSLAIKFYDDAEEWKNIYDHNKLTETVLTKGVVLEIPRL